MADEVYRLQGGTDPECRLFQKFADLGHYGDRGAGTTRQGTYVATPSGVLLASINSNDPERVALMMQRGLAKWETLSRAERLLTEDPQKQTADLKRPERYYPKDGLVLHVTSRDLPRESPGTGWRGQAWNQDFAWFTRKEARQLLGPQPQLGQMHEVPQAIVNRIACAHLVDDVRGQTTPFDERDVEKARLSTKVTSVSGSVVTLRLEGETKMSAEGFRSQKHGFEGRMQGNATYDLQKERFLSFEMVAVGLRWGGTQNNSRRGDPGPAPIGYLFTLAGDKPEERIEPAHHGSRVYRAVVGGRN